VTATTRLGVITVDDEPLGLDNLRTLLQRHADIEIVAECNSGEAALEAIGRLKPDIAFLDVQMPQCDGFDVLERLGSALPAAMILVTAYDQYAVRAFEAGAIDYLLKPFDSHRFEVALARARERITWSAGAPPRRDRWVVKSAGQALFVDVAEIDWIEAADYYVCLHVGIHSHLLRRSMSDLAAEAEELQFARIHRSAIVNLEMVKSLETGADGEAVVVLQNGLRLAVSRRYKRPLQERLLGATGADKKS
jgi:two-component system LytT family response regulator